MVIDDNYWLLWSVVEWEREFFFVEVSKYIDIVILLFCKCVN